MGIVLRMLSQLGHNALFVLWVLFLLAWYRAFAGMF